MRILETLSAWNTAGSADLFLIANVLLNHLFCAALQYYPLRMYLRVKPRTAVLINFIPVLLSAAIYLNYPWMLSDIAVSQICSLIFHTLFFIPISFILLKGCAAQNLFVAAYVLCIAMFVLGFSNWLEVWYGGLILPDISGGVAALARLILIPISIPLGVWPLTRMLEMWDGSSAAPFWRFIWIVPATLFMQVYFSGNILTLSVENNVKFLLTRVLSVIALQVCVSMMVSIMKREQEMAEAREQANLLDLEGKMLDRSRVEILKAWDKTNTARKEVRKVVEDVLVYVQDCDHAQIDKRLQEYIVSLNAASVERICENTAVNALASYYAALAHEKSIDISFKLHLPKQVGQIQNLDLSRIVGNMLENAIEASSAMDAGTGKIRLQSLMQGGTLVLVMDNNFCGSLQKKENGKYHSNKRENGVGTGLSSIQAAAEKYEGTAVFEVKSDIFQTSVQLNLD